MESTPRSLRYSIDDGIATILFDRPEKLNAFTRPMAEEFIALLGRADADDVVRVVIVTGSGRAFCAGADLTAGSSVLSSDIAKGPIAADGTIDWSHRAVRDFGGLVALRLFDCLKPVIFAFNGPAAGVGVTMSLAADFRLASRTAKFALPFTRRGIVPESTSSWFLPRIVGISKALEWTMIGRTFSADEALAAGLVRSLHEPQELLPAAAALAREIIEYAAPVSVALTRQLLWRMLGAGHPMEAHRLESRGVFSRAQSADIREGVASFLEKRAPQFTNKVSEDMPDFFPWWDEPKYD